MSSQLAEIAARAGLVVDGHTGSERLVCSYPARWPGVTFTVAAAANLLAGALEAAAADVADLWPGRAADDGALSLLAIGLQGVLDVRRAPASAVVLTPSGTWVTEPPDDPLSQPTTGSDGLEWRAERDRAAG
jgi:hypothetical protein